MTKEIYSEDPFTEQHYQGSLLEIDSDYIAKQSTQYNIMSHVFPLMDRIKYLNSTVILARHKLGGSSQKS